MSFNPLLDETREYDEWLFWAWLRQLGGIDENNDVLDLDDDSIALSEDA